MKNAIKSIALILMLPLSFITVSCSKSDTPDPVNKETVKEKPKEEPNEEEAPEEVLSPEASNKIADNVIIGGSTKVEGVPPIPNEAITLTASTDWGNAFLIEGFNINLDSEGEMKGAYVQFKATNAAVSESYYDVDLAENQLSAKAIDAKKTKPYKRYSNSKPSFSFLDVDFNTEITTGEFCYLVSIYDDDGNISAPKEICVTVQDWGGIADLVGEWHLTKTEIYSPVADVMEKLAGVEYCSDDVYNCDNQSVFSYSSCSTKQESYTFNADGTYSRLFQRSGTRLDSEALEINCSPTYENFSATTTINGNWYYDVENRNIQLVDYEVYLDFSDFSSETLIMPGNAFVYASDYVTLKDGFFTLGLGDELIGKDLNGDGFLSSDDSSYLDYFEKQ